MPIYALLFSDWPNSLLSGLEILIFVFLVILSVVSAHRIRKLPIGSANICKDYLRAMYIPKLIRGVAVLELVLCAISTVYNYPSLMYFYYPAPGVGLTVSLAEWIEYAVRAVLLNLAVSLLILGVTLTYCYVSEAIIIRKLNG